MKPNQIDRALDRLDREREEMIEHDYQARIRRDRYRRYQVWRKRVEDCDE